MSEKEAAEKRIRHIMDEVDKTAILDEQIFELKAWKKSLRYNIGEKIRLKCCTKFSRGRCKLTEVSPLNVLSFSNFYRSSAYILTPKAERRSSIIKWSHAINIW